MNTILFITKKQGYNEDTIVLKLIRYLLLTTTFNIAYSQNAMTSKLLFKELYYFRIVCYDFYSTRENGE